MNGSFLSFNLLPAWRKYLDFETFSREKDGDVASFIREWESKMTEAQSVGCEYSDLVLALKLIEKVNLKNDFADIIITTMEPTVNGSVLSQVVGKLKEQYDNDRADADFVDDMPCPDDDFLAEDDILSTSPIKTESMVDDKSFDVDMTNTATLSCPDCDSILRNHPEYPTGDIMLCLDCQNLAMIKTNTASNEVEVAVMLKCPKCFKSLMPCKGEATANETFGGFQCTGCGLSVAKDILNVLKPKSSVPSVEALPRAETETNRVRKCSKRVNSNKKYGCIHCGEQYSTLADIEAHSKKHASVLTCSLCHKKFLNQPFLLKHMKKFHYGGIVDADEPQSKIPCRRNASFTKCIVCGKNFMLRATLEKHMLTHPPVETFSSHDDGWPAPMKAESKGGSAVKRTSTARSAPPFTPPPVKAFGCSICDKRFIRKNNLLTHLKSVHGKDPLFFGQIDANIKCDGCSLRFPTIDRLVEHTDIECSPLHQLALDGSIKEELAENLVKYDLSNGLVKISTDDYDASPTPTTSPTIYVDDKGSIEVEKSAPRDKYARVPCEICGKTVAMSHIRAHLGTHDTSRNYECTLCHKLFKSALRLKIHGGIHKTTRDFICSYCGKGFKTKATMKEHMNMHTKTKVHACSSCDKTFHFYHSLRVHIRMHHTGEKPYKCDICETRFYTSCKKLDHMRAHTGEKPFACNVCGKAFRNVSTRKRHLKNVHKDVKILGPS